MKNLRSFVSFATLLAAVVLLLLPMPAAAQGSFSGVPPQNQQNYGFTEWGINNQRVASQYNYVIDTRNGLGSGLGLFTFPSYTCLNMLTLPGRGGIDPMATPNTGTTTLPQVRILDNTSANSETVSQTAAPSTNGGGAYCSINISGSNTHTQGSYILTSPTCGLREALNDLGTTGGTVIITQEWYALPQGCTQATITGIAGQLMANQYILDISNGQYQPYDLKPTATTNIAAAVAPTTATIAGGTFTNGNVIACVTYVDVLGGESVCQTNETTQATGGTTNGITVTSPAASAGAVGYRAYLTAVGGSSGTEVNHTTLTNCAQSVLVTIAPTCAIGASSTILAPITATSKVPPLATAHTLIAFQPTNGLPSVSPTGTAGNTQLFALSNPAVTVSSGTNQDVAEIIVPANYFSVGKSYAVCGKIATATEVATSVITIKLNLIATARQQTAIAVTTLPFATQTMAAAGTIQGCAKWTVAASGASGTIMSSTPYGPWRNTLNSTPNQTASPSEDVSTAASSAVDLTKQTFLSLNFAAATANVTGVSVLDLTVTPLLTN